MVDDNPRHGTSDVQKHYLFESMGRMCECVVKIHPSFGKVKISKTKQLC